MLFWVTSGPGVSGSVSRTQLPLLPAIYSHSELLAPGRLLLAMAEDIQASLAPFPDGGLSLLPPSQSLWWPSLCLDFPTANRVPRSLRINRHFVLLFSSRKTETQDGYSIKPWMNHS